MFKKKPKPKAKQKAKELKRVHKSDDLQRTYELAQQLANEQQERATIEVNCCKCM